MNRQVLETSTNAEKAVKGHNKRSDAKKDVFKHPSPIGTPLAPSSSGQKGEASSKKLGSQQMIKPKHDPFMHEQEVKYEPRKVPRYASSRETYDDEKIDFNFQKGIPVHKSDEPHTTLHSADGRLPDEFHNTRYEMMHPEQIQPTHYDHYDPLVEGFFGPGYSFEPEQRAHHKAHSHQYRHFPPGHYPFGDIKPVQDWHQDTSYPGHGEMTLADPVKLAMDHFEDERASMDLYLPSYEPHLDPFLDPYKVYEAELKKKPSKDDQSKARSEPRPAGRDQKKHPIVPTTDPRAYDGYFDNLFKDKKNDSQVSDAIGTAREQQYFQEMHTGHHIAPVYPYDQYESYYMQMYPGDKLDHVQDVYSYEPVPYLGATHRLHPEAPYEVPHQ